jgi:hypothetical protein
VNGTWRSAKERAAFKSRVFAAIWCLVVIRARLIRFLNDPNLTPGRLGLRAAPDDIADRKRFA